MSNSFGRFVLGTMVGGAIGAVMGILLAPRSGAETREMIKDEMAHRYTDSVNQIRESREQLKEKVDDVKTKVRDLSDNLEETGRKALNRWKEKPESETTSSTSV